MNLAQVILQPAGGSDATEHYHRTIGNPVRLERMKSVLTQEDLTALTALFPDGRLRVWGVVPGVRNQNKSKWARFEQDDLVLFCGHGGIFASAFVKYKTHNRQLALMLWRTDREEGQTWEYVYFVNGLRSHRIGYLDLNRAAGYSENYVVQGVTVLDAKKSAKVISELGLLDD